MKKINKFLCTIITILFSLSMMTSCNQNSESSQNSNDTVSNSINTSEKNDAKSIKITEMDTPYTMCYQNPDNTYSMFIYAAPIQYFDGNSYIAIDNSIITSNHNDYLYENKANSIKTYFPESISQKFLISNNTFELYFNINVDVTKFKTACIKEYTNIYNQTIDAICYESSEYSIYCYPSYAGIEIETVSNSGISSTPELVFDYDNDFYKTYDNYNNGYILLRNEHDVNNIDGIIYNPITKNDNNYSATMRAKVKYTQGEPTSINYNLDSLATTVNQSIVLYTSNMPDSCVYSNFNKNQYLSRFSYLGNSEQFGEGLVYLRFRLDYYLLLNPENVINANYNLRVLNDFNEASFTTYENHEQWSSTGMVWKNRSTNYTKLNSVFSKKENTYLSIDITDYAKKCFSDVTWMTESYGLTLGYDGNLQIIASSDNPMFIPYLEITLSELPVEFYPMEDINPS